jgi:hypothetical protein
MGHTAGIHTRSREAAIRYGNEMPASRVTVNTPTTHGAIGFSTALPPSMTLGCGSWGGNVTSDNVSPLHLMDIKRVAFETRPVKSVRPAQTSQKESAASQPVFASAGQRATRIEDAGAAAPHPIGRQEIAAIVDRFLAGRSSDQVSPEQPPLHASASPARYQPVIDVEAGTMYDRSDAAPQATAAPQAVDARGGSSSSSGGGVDGGGNGTGSTSGTPAPSAQPGGVGGGPSNGASQPAAANGHKAVDFVSEDDVRRAVQKGEKIYINSKTIITPSARDIGEPAEVFAKG